MKRLELVGFEGKPLPLVLDGEPGGGPLALVFPGLRYSPARPLLHYTRKLLRSRGWAVAEVWYDYDRPEFLNASAAERERQIAADADSVCSWASAGDLRLLVGKSIGSIALALLARDSSRARKSAKVWLTPLVSEPLVSSAIKDPGAPALLAAGEADPATPRRFLEELLRPGLHLLSLPHADHSLENSDPFGSLNILRDYLLALDAFLEAL